MMGTFFKIALFELRYQLKNPVFWVIAALFFLLTFGAVTVDNVQIGSGGNINVNSPVAIAFTHMILTLFFMFVVTAFVSNVIVRDAETGFGNIVRSTPVSKFNFLMGRFTGVFIFACIAFLAVPVAMWLGSLMPWLDPETIGPNRLSYYAFAYLFLAVPSIFFTSAIFFAVATVTRSMMYTYLGVMAFLVLYVIMNAVVGSQPEWRDLASLVEPFGLAALGNITRYWTAAESNTVIPALTGVLLTNRVLWISVSLVALVFAFWRFSFTEKGISKRKLKKQQKRSEKLAAIDPEVVDELPAARPGQATWARLITMMRFEMGQIFKSPGFFILMLVGLFNALGSLVFMNEIYGTPARPATFMAVTALYGSFAIIPVIIAIVYSGEVVWRDRDRGIHEIVDSTSLPNWAYMVPKSLAVAAVLIATLVIAMIAAILVQVFKGYSAIDLAGYFNWWLLPLGVDMLILAALAVFVQALSPNKYIGWGIMLLVLVAQITFNNIGWEHPLYQYGDTGFPQLSDMNGNAVSGATGWWLRLYWGGVALMLAVLAHLLWRRGTETRLMPRLRQLPRRLLSPSGAMLAGLVVVVLGSGAFIFYNMNVLNDYRTSDDTEQALADYEKQYLQYESVKQPSTTDIKLRVDLYPNEKRMLAEGEYTLVNDTGAPVENLHVRFQDQNLEVLELDVDGAELEHEGENFKHRIYRFQPAMQPDEIRSLRFQTRRWQRGFRANGNDTRMVKNGTFLNNSEFAPIIGMDRSGLLSDRATRRKHDLPPELRIPKLEDESARQQNYIFDADWVNADITVSTVAGQTPIAPGQRVSDKVENGRRIAQFRTEAPILAFFSVQSADYALEERMHDGVELQVYYHPAHDFNVATMLDAAEASLDYYQTNFGDYQFEYARVLEFPGYASFAQAFAGTMPYSEAIGFMADNTDPEAIDYVTYVTAHEIGHQYWAHQLISANKQGGTLLVETMAQYSALMVMKQLYGKDKIRRFLKFELDRYLSARGGEVIEELPLNRVENQGYIHYRKGAVVMYLLQDRLGEDRVNAMLADLLDQYRFKSQPYAESTDLVQGFKSLARNADEQQLVSDLLERITIYDLQTTEAVVNELDDGRFETVLTIEAKKFYADGLGAETEAELDDQLEVGLFTARPGVGAFDSEDVILMERRPVESGEQTIRLVSKTRPEFAGIDPYNKYIDRNSDDNLTGVSSG